MTVRPGTVSPTPSIYTPTPPNPSHPAQHFCKASRAIVPHIAASEDFLAPNQIRLIPCGVCVGVGVIFTLTATHAHSEVKETK